MEQEMDIKNVGCMGKTAVLVSPFEEQRSSCFQNNQQSCMPVSYKSPQSMGSDRSFNKQFVDDAVFTDDTSALADIRFVQITADDQQKVLNSHVPDCQRLDASEGVSKNHSSPPDLSSNLPPSSDAGVTTYCNAITPSHCTPIPINSMMAEEKHCDLQETLSDTSRETRSSPVVSTSRQNSVLLDYTSTDQSLPRSSVALMPSSPASSTDIMKHSTEDEQHSGKVQSPRKHQSDGTEQSARQEILSKAQGRLLTMTSPFRRHSPDNDVTGGQCAYDGYTGFYSPAGRGYPHGSVGHAELQNGYANSTTGHFHRFQKLCEKSNKMEINVSTIV